MAEWLVIWLFYLSLMAYSIALGLAIGVWWDAKRDLDVGLGFHRWIRKCDDIDTDSPDGVGS